MHTSSNSGESPASGEASAGKRRINDAKSRKRIEVEKEKPRPECPRRGKGTSSQDGAKSAIYQSEKPGEAQKEVPCDFEGNTVTIKDNTGQLTKRTGGKKALKSEDSDVGEKKKDSKKAVAGRALKPDRNKPREVHSDEAEASRTSYTHREDTSRQQTSHGTYEAKHGSKRLQAKENPTGVLSVNPDEADVEPDCEDCSGKVNRSIDQRADRGVRKDRSHGDKIPQSSTKPEFDLRPRVSRPIESSQASNNTDRGRNTPSLFENKSEKCPEGVDSDQSTTSRVAGLEEDARQFSKPRQDRRQ